MKLRGTGLVVVAVLAAACGTTVDGAGAGPAGIGPAGSELGGTTGSTSPLAGQAGAGGGAIAGAGSVSAGASADTGPGTTTALAPGVAGSRAPAAVTPNAVAAGIAPGVTPTTITIGAEWSSGFDETLKKAGVTSISTGNVKDETQILVDYINKHGGVAGRKLKVVYHDYPASSTQSGDQAAAAACSDFTQDHHVFAVLAPSNAHLDSFRACLSKASTLLISDTAPEFDDATLAKFPTFLPILAMGIDRRVVADIDNLVAEKFFTPWDYTAAAPAKVGQVKVGLVSIDSPLFTSHIPQIRAELERHGLHLDAESRVRLDNNQDAGADLQSAILHFSADHIDHVIFNQEGSIAGLFAQTAAQQHYYPRYGFDTFDFPQVTLDTVPGHKAFYGMLGIGWAPFTDVHKPPPLGAKREACLKIFSDRGISSTSANQISVLLQLCDEFFFFDRVASAVGQGLTTASFLAATSQLSGPTFSYFSFGLDLTNERDGISSVARLKYDAGCDCIVYTKTGIRVG